jgi:GTP:adenosylcobinamide-phosphate guanylyltransferase
MEESEGMEDSKKCLVDVGKKMIGLLVAAAKNRWYNIVLKLDQNEPALHSQLNHIKLSFGLQEKNCRS